MGPSSRNRRRIQLAERLDRPVAEIEEALQAGHAPPLGAAGRDHGERRRRVRAGERLTPAARFPRGAAADREAAAGARALAGDVAHGYTAARQELWGARRR